MTKIATEVAVARREAEIVRTCSTIISIISFNVRGTFHKDREIASGLKYFNFIFSEIRRDGLWGEERN